MESGGVGVAEIVGEFVQGEGGAGSGGGDVDGEVGGELLSLILVGVVIHQALC